MTMESDRLASSRIIHGVLAIAKAGVATDLSNGQAGDSRSVAHFWRRLY